MRNILSLLTVSAISLVIANPVYADPIVDGMLSPGEYGNPTATVLYDPTAPDSNFGNPTPVSKYVGYNIYQTSANGYYYALFQATPNLGGNAVGTFANLYFDLDPQNNNGSDLGFELSATSSDAFIPGVSGSVKTPEIKTAASADGNTLEVAIPISDFMMQISGLNYSSGQQFPKNGDPVILRISQTFGYTANGGPTYGPNRLGATTLDDGSSNAVPEPGSIALFGVGLLGLGFVVNKKRFVA